MKNINSEDKMSCSTGNCIMSDPKTLSFVVPFLAVLALEQWAAHSNSCVNAVVCQMCIISKIAVAFLAGLIGLGLSRLVKKV